VYVNHRRPNTPVTLLSSGPGRFVVRTAYLFEPVPLEKAAEEFGFDYRGDGITIVGAHQPPAGTR
jgi:hypothetical protein